MVVYILPRNLASLRDSGDIQKDIENVVGFNIKLEHSINWREEKTAVIDQNAELNEIETMSTMLQREPTDAEKMAIRDKHKRIEVPIIHIHPDVKKVTGQPVTLTDILIPERFGNCITQTQLILKNGEKVPVTICVFPHASEFNVNAKLIALKNLVVQ